MNPENVAYKEQLSEHALDQEEIVLCARNLISAVYMSLNPTLKRHTSGQALVNAMTELDTFSAIWRA